MAGILDSLANALIAKPIANAYVGATHTPMELAPQIPQNEEVWRFPQGYNRNYQQEMAIRANLANSLAQPEGRPMMRKDRQNKKIGGILKVEQALRDAGV